MKKTFILIALFFTCYISFAQNVDQFSLQDIKSGDDLNKAAKKAAAYILATPADTTVIMRKEAESFLFAWMDKTKDYSFSVDYSAAKLIEENKSEAFVYFAAMVDCVFKDKTQSDDQVKTVAMKRLIEYSKNTANNLTPGPELKKAIKADKKGNLSKYLADSK